MKITKRPIFLLVFNTIYTSRAKGNRQKGKFISIFYLKIYFIDELENKKLMKFVTVPRDQYYQYSWGFLCRFFSDYLHAAHFARSFLTNSYNLGKYTFVISSPFVLTIPKYLLWTNGIT